MTKSYLLSEEIRNALLSYLHERPYREVARGVALLEGLPEAAATAAPAPLALVPDAGDTKEQKP